MIIRSEDRLQVTGNVTMATVSALFNEGLKPRADTKMVIDFAQLETVDSSAVSLMLSWLREAQRSKATLCFANVPDNVMSLAKLYGVAELLMLCTAD